MRLVLVGRMYSGTNWLEAEGKVLCLGFFGLTWVRKGVYSSYTLEVLL